MAHLPAQGLVYGTRQKVVVSEQPRSLLDVVGETRVDVVFLAVVPVAVRHVPLEEVRERLCEADQTRRQDPLFAPRTATVPVLAVRPFPLVEGPPPHWPLLVARVGQLRYDVVVARSALLRRVVWVPLRDRLVEGHFHRRVGLYDKKAVVLEVRLLLHVLRLVVALRDALLATVSARDVGVRVRTLLVL